MAKTKAVKPKKVIMVPFDNDGNQLGYPETYNGLVEKENYEFQDSLLVEDYYRGRSACGLKLYSTTTGKSFVMFITDAIAMLHSAKLVDGGVSGTWTFQKKGANFGVRLVGAKTRPKLVRVPDHWGKVKFPFERVAE